MRIEQTTVAEGGGTSSGLVADHFLMIGIGGRHTYCRRGLAHVARRVGVRDAGVSGEAARILEQIRLPVVLVNGDLWPIDYEANRRHMLSFDAIVLKGADHFLMMNRPQEFNQALEKAIHTLATKPVKN
ncbi:MAG: hypothetical protein ABFE13_04085 [Phycisphaerales bacterium]